MPRFNPHDVGVTFILGNSPSATLAHHVFYRARQKTPATAESPADVPNFTVFPGAPGLPRGATKESLTAALMSRAALFIGVSPNDELTHVLQCTARVIIFLAHDAICKPHTFPAYTVPGEAVCLMMWKLFFPNEPPPMAVQLLSSADTYMFGNGEKEPALALQRALKEPGAITQDLLTCNHPLSPLIERGESLLQAETARHEALVHALQFAPTRIIRIPDIFTTDPDPSRRQLGYITIALRMIDSMMPGDYNLWGAVADEFYKKISSYETPNVVAFLSPPGPNDVGAVKVSLRRDNSPAAYPIDLARFAALYGGGGRSGAAAFMLPTMLTATDAFPNPPEDGNQAPG